MRCQPVRSGASAAAGVQRATCVYNYAYNSTTRCHLMAVPPYSRLLLSQRCWLEPGWSRLGPPKSPGAGTRCAVAQDHA